METVQQPSKKQIHKFEYIITTTEINFLKDAGVPAYWLGLRRGAFTCVGWQVTLCDPIWQVMSRSCEMGVPLTAIHCFTFFYIQYLQITK